ncbi:SDR family oxidoreductase [Lentiprolixibacter aurantiacus]|uniref:SDR family oxidoreductase n=1 Tax=Lentiprolixibacter aurantiacus TaxID=2993939 RepID=A0AAE3SNQ0_9FLAO|nr:SDR family oxidoreductase [Lentiprolixibacter aurantiacus]MCX2719416.1 SDR family oxidoreductase [Lentiprolixibacter aurantiacus]
MAKEVVLVTGASSGIGRAIAEYLHKKGYAVYGTTRDVSKYPDFGPFRLIKLDVNSAEQVRDAVKEVVGREGQLNILVNNAGVGITGPIEETPYDEILKAFETNFHGPIRMIKEVLPHMREQGKGLIINITSIAGYMGLPFRGVYSASKGALELVTEALRMETQGFDIRITNLAPGDFATNIASGRYHAPVKEGSPYQEVYQNSLDLMNAHVDSGQDPIKVAEKTYTIIKSHNPKVHYRVGTPLQKFSVFLKKILPDKVYEGMLKKHYKL